MPQFYRLDEPQQKSQKNRTPLKETAISFY